MRKIIKISIGMLALVFSMYILIFFLFPSSLIDFYRGEDETTIWVKVKWLPIRKEISNSDTYKAPDLQWSPNRQYFAFYDMIMAETFTKEWALKIINSRTFQVKTIFIGDYKTGEYRWIDDNTIRVYVSAGTGVRIYRDININTSEPFIASEHTSPEYWMPEKNSASSHNLKQQSQIQDVEIKSHKDGAPLFLAIIEWEKDLTSWIQYHTIVLL